MAGYSIPTRESDPVHTVRTIGRMAQMLLELRDEYVREARPDTLDQIMRRLDEMDKLSGELRERMDAQEQSESGDSDDRHAGGEYDR